MPPEPTLIESLDRLMEAAWFENLMIAYFCVMAFVAAIVAIAKGRSLLWGVPIVLFPPTLILLLRLPRTRRAEQVQCQACLQWNPLRRTTCARCGLSLDDASSMVD
ncbi:MAG: hypothetical protein P1V51_09505 [Deltaproteobacteria bacterium]|nr:hypothetical protein [Deltaproteobacteria bacterium]